MSEIQKIEYICDICNKEINEKDILTINYPIFVIKEHPDKTSCEPYIIKAQTDVCKKCAEKVVKQLEKSKKRLDSKFDYEQIDYFIKIIYQQINELKGNEK